MRKQQSHEESSSESSDAELCRFVKFSQQIIHRQQIKGAEYNPRLISDENKKRLRANLETTGLLNSLVWNQRSGNLVSGHQRIGILDALMGTDNYKLPVDVVDLGDKEEKEQNIFFNNHEAQGSWDVELLGKCLKDEGIDSAKMGFSTATVYQMFGGYPLAGNPEQTMEMAKQMREARERYDSIKKACGKRDDVDYYLVVFASHEDRKKFTDACGLPDNRFVDGSKLASLIVDDIDAMNDESGNV